MVNAEIRLTIFFAAEEGEALNNNNNNKKKRLGTDCGSDHELLIAKFSIEESRENH